MKVLKRLNNQLGFISIETVIVAGLVIGLGAFAISSLFDPTKEILSASIDKVFSTLDIKVSESAL